MSQSSLPIPSSPHSVSDEHDHGVSTNVYYGLRSLYIPTSPKCVLASQMELFDRFVRTPTVHRKYRLGDGNYINYVEIKNKESKNQTTLVLAHGYGAGLGLFFDNYDGLATIFARVISIDWLGMGGSSRPGTSWLRHKEGSEDAPVDFFIDSLKEFVDGTGLSQDGFVLMGHSLGGYLSGRFLTKFQRSSGVQGLILLSAAGLDPHPPPEVQVDKSALSNNMQWLHYLWESDFTPQFAVRALGPFASSKVKKVVNRRFGDFRWQPDDADAISTYIYRISALPASGEYSLKSILVPLIRRRGSAAMQAPDNSPPQIIVRPFARVPLSPAVLSSGAMLATTTPVAAPPTSVPVLILYGDNDWIAFPKMHCYVRELNDLGVDAQLQVIERAGHHLYMDNPDAIHDAIAIWWTSKISS